MRKLNYRTIEKETGCNAEQAKYLVAELKKYPKVKDIFLEHLSEINLRNCDEVKVVMAFGFMDNTINIVCKRLRRDLGCIKIYNNYKYSLSAVFPEKIFYEVF